MADKELGSLTSATTLDGTETHYVVQGGNSRKVAGSEIVKITHNQAWSTITGTPTTLSGYGITDAQPLDSDLTAIAALDKTDGNFIVADGTQWTVESGATARTSLGLGTAATTDATDYATAAQGTKADSALQPGDIGTSVQAQGATLDSLEGLTLAANDLVYATAADTLTNLATGSTGEVLKVSATGAPEWGSVAGTGDMLSSVYDPNAKGADAFDMANMVEATDAKVMTAAERANLAKATLNDDTDVSGNSWVLDEDDMASDSDTKVPTQQSVKDYVDAGTVLKVADRTALKAVDTGAHTVVFLRESGREGQFVWTAGDLSALVSADTREGIYVAPDSDATGASGAWVRVGEWFAAGLNVRWFGAIGDGVSDDSDALSGAVTLASAIGRGVIYFPAGRYKNSASLAGTDVFITFKGDGSRVSEILYTGSTKLFDVRASGNETAFYKIAGLLLNTETVSGGTAIYVANTASSGVVGETDILHLDDVVVDAEGAGYWTKSLEQENTGGVYGSNFSFKNNNSATAQQDVSTIGVHINNSNSEINIIRAFHGVNFYIQRFYNGILADAALSIESIYISNYEILARFGVHAVSTTTGTGNVGAVSIIGGHIDANQVGVFGECLLTFVRLIGADIRMNGNGTGAIGQPGDNNFGVDVNAGEQLTITGCTISGAEEAFPSLTASGVRIGGNYKRAAVGDNTLVKLDNGVMVTDDAFDISLGINEFAVVSNKYVITTSSSDVVLGASKEDWSSDLNDEASGARGFTHRRIANGATNRPIGSAQAGAHVLTQVWDANAARQIYLDAGSDRIWTRRKQAGVFHNWRNIDIGAGFTLINVDEDRTLGSNNGRHVRHSGTLTADRAINLSTSDVAAGVDRFVVTRTGPGAFNLSVGGLKNLAPNQWCEVVYDGSAWYLAAFGSL